MSQWNWDKENIYRHIQKKYSLPKLIKPKDAKNKIVRGVLEGYDKVLIAFKDNTALAFKVETDYDGAPEIEFDDSLVDTMYLLIQAHHDNFDRDWKEYEWAELRKLVEEFDEEERGMLEEAQYKRLKEKFDKEMKAELDV